MRPARKIRLCITGRSKLEESLNSKMVGEKGICLESIMDSTLQTFFQKSPTPGHSQTIDFIDFTFIRQDWLQVLPKTQFFTCAAPYIHEPLWWTNKVIGYISNKYNFSGPLLRYIDFYWYYCCLFIMFTFCYFIWLIYSLTHIGILNWTTVSIAYM